MEERKKPTKVYRYGCLPPVGEDLALVWSQLRLAFMYRLALWNMSMASRSQYRQRRREMLPELEAVEAELERISELYRLSESKPQKKMYSASQKLLRQTLKELREAAKTNEAFLKASAEDQEREGVLRRALRGAFSQAGLYSGTYLLVEDADRRARTGNRDPVKPRWNWTGSLGIQLQGGRTAPDLWSGADPSVQVVPPQREGKSRRVGSRSVIRYRVCSRDRKPVCINLKAMIDRDLPADSRVTWARLVVSRCGATAIGGRPRYAYSVQLTIESETFFRSEFGGGEVAICFSDDKVTFAGEGEPTSEFPTPPPFQKLADLQSIRDKNKNGALGLVRAWCERQEDPPGWIVETAEHAGKSSPRRSVRFVEALASHAPVGDPDEWKRLIKALKKWVYHENHLYQWQENARAGWLRNRKDRYLNWAAQLRRKYRHVILDSRRLDAPELRTKERNARGLHELRLAIKHSFGEEYVHETTGKDCEEMFERFREEHKSLGARLRLVGSAAE